MHASITLASCFVFSPRVVAFVPHIRPQNNYLPRQHVIVNTSTDDLSQLTVPQLKEQLKRNNLPVGGRKQELIDRLKGFQSNNQTPTIDDDEVHVDDENDDHAVTEDLDSLTVPLLKERLKSFRLPVAGRKQELVERLRSHHSHESSLSPVAVTAAQELPRIGDFGNDNAIGKDSIVLEKTIIEENQSKEDHKSIRARRKKYFKTQEVRECIRANDPRAPQKAEEMIATLELMAVEENDDAYLPGPKQYTTLIDAYSNSDTRSAEAVIERILQSNLDLTTTMMNAIIGAYVNMGTIEGAKEAMAILERMEYTRDFGGGAVKPTVYSYSLVISAWAKCGSIDAAINAENILIRLIESYDNEILRNGRKSEYSEELKPNSVVFNGVIDAWANSGSSLAGKKAEEFLNKMEVYSRMEDQYDVRPDTITFNTCIKAWCNSKHVDASIKAEDLLSKLETHPEYPKRNGVLIVRPNLLSYNTVINSWAKSSMPESAARAESLLTRMLKRYKSESFSTIKPDVITFSSVLNALAKSKVQHKAEKCLALLESMIDIHEDDGSYSTSPNVICFNTILNACAFSASGGEDERKKALSVAVKVFKMLKEEQYAHPDAVSYGNMLKCCANLMPISDVRTSMASNIFSSCCEQGLVGGMVLDEIRRCILAKQFLKLLAKCGYSKPLKQHSNAMSVTLRQLPRQWTANVKRGDMFTRQRGASLKRQQQSKNEGSKAKPNPVIRNPTYHVEPSWAYGKDI